MIKIVRWWNGSALSSDWVGEDEKLLVMAHLHPRRNLVRGVGVSTTNGVEMS